MLAKKEGADYLGVGPIFATKTKLDAGRPLGVELITKIKKNLRIPVVAIGGINLVNAKVVVNSQADGLCAISEVVSSSIIRERIKEFQSLFK